MKRQLLAILSAIIALTVSYASADTAIFKTTSPSNYPSYSIESATEITSTTGKMAGLNGTFTNNNITLTISGITATTNYSASVTLGKVGQIQLDAPYGYLIKDFSLYAASTIAGNMSSSSYYKLTEPNGNDIICTAEKITDAVNSKTAAYFSLTNPKKSVIFSCDYTSTAFQTLVVTYEAEDSGNQDLDPTWTWDFNGERGITAATVTYAGESTALPTLVGAEDQTVTLSSTDTDVLAFDENDVPVIKKAGKTNIIASVAGYKPLSYSLTINKGMVGKWVDDNGKEITKMNINAADGLPSFVANVEGYTVANAYPNIVSFKDGKLTLEGGIGETSITIYGPGKGELTDDPLWESPATLWVTVSNTIAPWSWDLKGEEAVYKYAGKNTILPELINVPENVTPTLFSYNEDVIAVEGTKLILKGLGDARISVNADRYTTIPDLELTIVKGDLGQWMIGDEVVTEANYDANYPTELPRFVANSYVTEEISATGLREMVTFSNNTLSVDKTKMNVGDVFMMRVEAEAENYNSVPLSLDIKKRPSYVGVFTDPTTGEWVTEWTLDLSVYNAASDEEKATLLPVYTVYPNNLAYFPLTSSDESVATFDTNGIHVVGKGTTNLQINNNNGNYDGNFVLKFKVIGSATVTEDPVAYVTSKYANVAGAAKEYQKWFEGYPIAPNNIIYLESEDGATISWSMDDVTYYKESQISFDAGDAGKNYVFYVKAEKEGKEPSEIVQLPVSVKDWVLVENNQMVEDNKYFVLATSGTYAYTMLNNGDQNAETGEGTMHYAKTSTKVNNGRAIRTIYDMAIMERDAVNQTMKVINVPATFANRPYINYLRYNGKEYFNYADQEHAHPVTITIDEATAIANVNNNGYQLKADMPNSYTCNFKLTGTNATSLTDLHLYTWADAPAPEMTIKLNDDVVGEDAINDESVKAGDVITISVPFGFTISGEVNGEAATVDNRTATFVIPEKTAEVSIKATAVCETLNLNFEKTLNLPVYEVKYYHLGYDNAGNETESEIAEDVYGEFSATVSFGDKIRVVAPEKALKLYVKEKNDSDWTPYDTNIAVISAPRAHDTWFEYTVQALDADDNVLCTSGFVIYVSGVSDDSSIDNRHNFKGQEEFGGIAASSSLAQIKWLATETRTATHNAGDYHLFVPCSSEVALVNGHGLVINDGSLLRVGLNDNSGRRITKLTFKGDTNCAGIRIGRYAGDNNAHLIHNFVAVGKLGAQQGDGTVTWEYDPNDDFNLRELEIWHNPSARANAPRRAPMKVAANSTAATLHELTLTTDQPTGIDEVTTETVDVKWFDMQGRRVNAAKLLPGLYIRVIGNESSKVMVK